MTLNRIFNNFQNGVELVTCLCNDADYCNGNTKLRLDVHLRILALVILLLI